MRIIYDNKKDTDHNDLASKPGRRKSGPPLNTSGLPRHKKKDHPDRTIPLMLLSSTDPPTEDFPSFSGETREARMKANMLLGKPCLCWRSLAACLMHCFSLVGGFT